MTRQSNQSKLSRSLKPRQDLKAVSKELASLNRELATQMIVLASQTGDVNALTQSAAMLRRSQERFSPENTPQENAEIHLILASTLFQIARTDQNIETLEQAITEYRHAITLASVTGNERLRARIRKDYKAAKDYRGDLGAGPSHKGAA